MGSKKPEAELDPGKLRDLLTKATRGPWRISRGLMADNLNITAFEREPLGGDDGDGPICHVSTERLHVSRDAEAFGRGESRFWRTPIKKAEADARLIVAAVNALPELLRRLKLDIEETAWLIEWPADRHGPTRYYSPGEPPVIDSGEALRFARQKDAEAIIRAEKLQGCKPAEHMWVAPKRKAAA